MAQSYATISPTQSLAASLTPLLNRDDAASSTFSGTAFPSSNLLVGMLCYRTDQLKLYQLTSASPVTWTLIYDLSTGSMIAPNAAAAPWSGITGKPTTISGYGITDALNKTGDSATGKINFAAATAAAASLSVPHGAAPSTPVNGDVWSTTAALFVRVNGNTRTVSVLEAAETYAAKKTFVVGSTSAASANVPAGAAPTAPVDGDLWATTTQLVYRMNGVSRNVAFWDANSAVAVANGGTGANDAATARANLGLGSAAVLNAGTSATNVVQLDASAKLPAIDGSQLLATGGLLRAPQVLTSGTLYNAPPGCSRIYVEAVGGGGAGGGTPASGGNGYAGAGGGAGAYCAKLFPVTAGASYSYAVGSGGTGAANVSGTAGTASTFTVGGVTISAGGGGGGGRTNSTSISLWGQGGAGGTASGGDVNINGGSGGPGIGSSTSSFGLYGGPGGVSAFGGQGVTRAADTNGSAGVAGSGGSGSSSVSSSTSLAGGNGGAGFIRVWEFA